MSNPKPESWAFLSPWLGETAEAQLALWRAGNEWAAAAFWPALGVVGLVKPADDQINRPEPITK